MSDDPGPTHKLASYIEQGVLELAGRTLRFTGTLGGASHGRTELEAILGYIIPQDIADFLERFGGTKLFIGTFGTGTHILPLSEIAETNLRLQEGEPPFFPMFTIIGFDRMDDMLCLYNDGTTVHFGWLDHEAWGAQEAWLTEAMTFVPFGEWLDMFVASGGETVPDRKSGLGPKDANKDHR